MRVVWRFGYALLCLVLFWKAEAQNVGIGIANPTRARLEVAADAGNRTVAILGSEHAGVAFLQNPATIGLNAYHGDNYRSLRAGNGLLLQLNNAPTWLAFTTVSNAQGANALFGTPNERLTLFGNGNASINSNFSPGSSLFVAKTFSGTTTARFSGTQHVSIINDGFSGNTHINGGKTGSDVLINDVNSGAVYIGGGKTLVGINNPAPTAVLDVVQGNGLGVIWVVPTNFLNWEFRVVKNLTEPGSDYYLYYNEVNKGNFFHVDGKYYSYSDSRLKQDIRPLEGVAEKLMQLTPSFYSYKSTEGQAKPKTTIGFSAQQVYSSFPQLVTRMRGAEMGYPQYDNLHMMYYDQFGVLALQAIREQQQMIDGLKQANKKLEALISGLETNQKQ